MPDYGNKDAWAAQAAEKLSLAISTRSKPRWTPEPHQVPPAGDWRGWILLGGRGSGKTDACAKYITDHVNGPRCLPGETPHWIGIIAPTLGDAATSCFSGPSGLRRHDSRATMFSGPGGLSIRWPNGSEAKLFGAHTQEDVERLRSGGNRCVVWCCSKGTLIHTVHGQVPIEKIRTGDQVWTRGGLRRVKAAALTRRDAETLVIRTEDGHRLELTPDHRVWVVGDGWIGAQNVTPGCRMLAWDHLLQDRLHGTTGSRYAGAEPKRGTTRTTTVISCIARCGRRVSVLWTTTRCSITSIMTKRTTRSATSSRSPARSTARSTPRSRSIPTGSGCRPARVAGSVFVNSGMSGSPGTWSAIGAERSSSPQACAPSSAEAPVVRAVVVRSVEPSSTRVDTYDLEIDGEPEFFAEGLLIHNCEELAAWRYLDAAWPHMRLGLRAGPRPHWVASTTPKPRILIKKIARGTMRNVEVTRASTYDNPYLPEDVKDALEEEYGQTQLGRQELYAEILDEDENALWTREMLDTSRVLRDDVPDLKRISVGVDPSGGAGEQGIVVVGKAMVGYTRMVDGQEKKGMLAHGYVLGDHTKQLPPEGWGRNAVRAAVDYGADDIVVETNYGGDMAIATIRAAAEHKGVAIPVRKVVATRGKAVRAAPVAALTAQNRWHMAGRFEQLEDQLCTWYPELDWSPDRLDACLAAGTRITTRRGQVPVEQVTTQDQVWTRQGWKPVEWSGMTLPDAEVFEVSTRRGSLIATGNHRVWTQTRGFVRVDALVCTDRLALCPSTPYQWFSTVSRSLVALCRPIVRRVSTTRRTAKGSAPAVSDSSTSQSGEMPTVPRPSRRGASSITSTSILSTTTLRTSSASPVKSMRRFTRGRSTVIARSGWLTWSRSGRLLRSGTGATKAGSGTAGRPRRPMRNGNPGPRSARSAESSTALGMRGLRATALVRACVAWLIISSATGLRSPARSVGRSSCRASMKRSPKRAPSRVERVCALGGRRPVYDLTIRDVPEFYANGILVHNSVWPAWHLKIVGTAVSGRGSHGFAEARKKIG